MTADRSLRCLLAVLSLLPLCVQGQYWAKDVGGIGNDHVADVKIDADGSIYMTGEFGGTMTFGGQTYSSAGSIDLFVAKLDPAGEVLWFWRGGGPGIDRGLKVSVGTGDLVALTGEFLGTAVFQGNSLTSAGGTADMLVAVLNKSDGAIQWIRKGGGPAGTDRPYGISLAANGEVSVAGEFRGTATWEGGTLTSMIDPDTGQPGSDVFIVSYSSAGALEWLKKGTAKYPDRAIDLMHDATGNLYVMGQFSDTIAFDQSHPNILMNASFLTKFDGAGAEVWFRHMGGAGFNHVRDMLIKPDGKLLIVGDVQGSMIYFSTPQVNVPSNDPYAYYLLEVDATGALLDHITVGSESGVSASGLDILGGSVAVFGQFNCRFTDLSAMYGTGVFMAVGDEDLFISKHTASGLALEEGQQFGGRSTKTPGQIAFLPDGDLVFCGSYEDNIIFPAEMGFEADVSSWGGGLQGNGMGTYCGDGDYGAFAANVADELNDGFIARGYVLDREPYDWWRRTDSACDRVPLEPCIRQGQVTECQDTVYACGSVILNVALWYSYSTQSTANFLGPAVNYLWSNGSTNTTIAVTATGAYSVTVTSENGCWVWTDTIQVVIHPLPPIPLLSDDIVINTSENNVETVYLCDPETHWFWAENADPDNESYWTTPLGEQINNDSVRIDTSGVYAFYTVNEFGCARENSFVVVDNPTPELPDLLADLAINYPDDTDDNDTLSMCGTGSIAFEYVPTWTVNGVVGELPDGLLVNWGFQVPPTSVGDGGSQNTQLPQFGSGWYVHPLVVMVSNKPCGEDSVLFYATDSIYVEIYPAIDIDVDLAGPSVLCDGDTALLVATCIGCDTLAWSGAPGIVLSPDSMLVTAAGTYSILASVADTNGCSYSSSDQLTITIPTGPTLNVDPVDGIICPGQIATLSTTLVGTGHIWFGPEGPITGMGATLTTDVPGDYYLIMQVGGCSVTSNSVSLVNYGTPFLSVAPQPVLCSLDDEVTLQVVATAGSIVQWQAPLSGTGISQVVGTPGTYTVLVTACNITTTLTAEITLSTVNAELTTPGPFTLCNGDSVLLQAETDQSIHYWLPNMEEDLDLMVTGTGSYQFVAQDAAGCADSSAVVQVIAISFPEPVVAMGDTVCAGDAAQLTATGSGTMTWYADEAMTQFLGTGGSFSYVANGSTTLYVVQEEGGCMGTTEAVLVGVIPRPAALTMTGPTGVCLGTSLELVCLAPDSVDLLWTTPSGTYTTSTITIPNATLSDAGLYVCVPSWNGCNGPSAQQVITVWVPMELEMPEESLLCLGGAVTFTLPPGFSDPQWSTGSTAESIMVGTTSMILLEAKDEHGCAASDTMDVIVEECDLIVPNVFTPNGDGSNDAWYTSGGFTDLTATIYNRWGRVVYEGDIVAHPWDGTHMTTGDPCSEGVYYYVLHMQRFRMEPLSMAGYIQLLH